MKLYVKITLQELKKYMKYDWFNSESYFDPLAEVWFIPKKYYEEN